MKRVFLLLSLFLATSLINAQGFGVQLGLNSSKLSGSIIIKDGDTYTYPIKASGKSGINIGVNYDVELSENLYVQPGLYFSQKGTKGYFTDGEDKATWDMSINYIEIPVLIKYKYEISDEISIIGLAGPSYNFGLSGTITEKYADYEANTYDLNLVSSFDEKDDSDSYQWKKSYFGLQIGAGVMYQNFELKLVYTAGLSNASVIDYKNDYGYAHKDDFKQNVFSINLGYRFMN